MPRAVWNDAVSAESDNCVEVEGNCYFPPNSVHKEYLEKSDYTTICPWKGQASYYDIDVDGKRLENGAWPFVPSRPPRRGHALKGSCGVLEGSSDRVIDFAGILRVPEPIV